MASGSPNLMEFDDSPRSEDPFAVVHAASLPPPPDPDDPFAIVAAASASVQLSSSSSSVATASPLFTPPPPAAHALTQTMAAARAAAASASAPSGSPSASSSASSSLSQTAAAMAPTELHVFLSCMEIDGHSIQSAPRSAQTLMRGAFNMLTATASASITGGGGRSSDGLGQGSGGSNTTGNSRSRPPTEVNVEVRVTREFEVVGSERMVAALRDPPPPLESESYWTERRRSRSPEFAVGVTLRCHTAAMRDRHVQFLVMIPEDSSSSNKNAQLFGYAQTSFQELLAIAESGDFAQEVALPLHSTVRKGASLTVKFAQVRPWAPVLFQGFHRVFRCFLFAPPNATAMAGASERSSGSLGRKLALEEAAEVDYSVKIPLQLLSVCRAELQHMQAAWRARYNYNRKTSRHFLDDGEALAFGHDVFRVQVVCARHLRPVESGLESGSVVGGEGGGSTGNGGGNGSGGQASSSNNNNSSGGARGFPSIAGGRNALMSRLKTQTDKWSGGNGSGSGSSSFDDSGSATTSASGPSATSGSTDSEALHTFAVVKVCDGHGATREHVVGRTNTEYDSSAPVWSMNNAVGSCPHGRPNTKHFVSPSLPSRVERCEVNQLKQFVFYRPSLAEKGEALEGWLRVEVYHERYGMLAGIENELMGEVLIPLQSVRDAMTVEHQVVYEAGKKKTASHAQTVQALTLVDWFDLRSPVTDAVRGQVQLRLHILLANPVGEEDEEEGVEEVEEEGGEDEALVAEQEEARVEEGDGKKQPRGGGRGSSPRRRRRAADTAPPPSGSLSASPLEAAMPMAFLSPHVRMLQRHIQEVSNMIRLCEHLVREHKTFKSSQHKKRADIQGIPTNLHVSFFRVLRDYDFDATGAASSVISRAAAHSTASQSEAARSRKPSTEDLLGLDFGWPSADDQAGGTATEPSTVQEDGEEEEDEYVAMQHDRARMAETHATVTCGAPTAHAMGLSEHGLRDMELEIHRLQSLLERCTPRLVTAATAAAVATAGTGGSGDNATSGDVPFVSEDAVEYAFQSLPDDGLSSTEENGNDEEDDDDVDAFDGDGDSYGYGFEEEEEAPRLSTGKKYSNMAARAVATANARARAISKRRPMSGKSSQPQHHQQQHQSYQQRPSTGAWSEDSEDAASADAAIKYPPLKVEPVEETLEALTGASSSSSASFSASSAASSTLATTQYAVRVLCRLEMLRTEYYLRKSVAVSQSVSSLVTCFLATLDLCLQQRRDAVLEQFARVGFLIGWESLISSHGKELRMLSDAWVAIKCLETFAFQLYESRQTVNGSNSSSSSSNRLGGRGGFFLEDIELHKREEVGYTIRVGVPSALFARLPEALRCGELVAVTSVLFTQGINEMQSLANMVGSSGVSIQRKINTTSFRSIVDYYKRVAASGIPLADADMGASPSEILRLLRTTVDGENATSKNTAILFHAADAVRSLHGGRVTYCKSGKDRTAMSVTLEQARLLVQRKRAVLQELLDGSSSSSSSSSSSALQEVKDDANVMRAFGVRIEIAKKNVGRYKYSFNSLQRKLLPDIYRPPMSTIQDIVTSVTARDS